MLFDIFFSGLQSKKHGLVSSRIAKNENNEGINGERKRRILWCTICANCFLVLSIVNAGKTFLIADNNFFFFELSNFILS
jgi:hypothetical protein